MDESVNTRAMQWIAGPDVGISSKTIWSALMGVTPDRSDIPSDTDDFSRCYKLLKRIPEWQERMPEVAQAYPKWQPLIARCDEMMNNYHRGHTNRIYEWSRGLKDDCMRADGYEQTGPHSWRKGSAFETAIVGNKGSITFSGGR